MTRAARSRRRRRSYLGAALLIVAAGLACGVLFSWLRPEAADGFRRSVLAALEHLLPGRLEARSYGEGIHGEPAGLNPLLYADAASQQVASLIFCGLTRVDGLGGVHPCLAESWEATAGGRLWRFALRSDAVWHDGRPVTPADVTFTVNSLADVEFPSDLRGEWTGHSAWQEGERDVVIQLPEADPDFPIRASVPILPRHLLASVPLGEWYSAEFSRGPVGCGPYKFSSWEAGREIALEANDAYFLGAPGIAEFVCRFFPAGGDAGLDGLTAAEFSGAGRPDGGLVSSAAAPQLLRRRDLTVARWPGPVFAAIVPNHRRTAGEAAVRQAMNLALDRTRLMSAMAGANGIEGQYWRGPDDQGGPYMLAGGAFLPGSEAAEGQPSDQAPDLGLARAALLAAGWADSDGDGVVEKGLTRLELALAYPADRPDLAAAAAEVKAQMAPLGIEVVPQALGLASFLGLWGPPFEFDLLLVEWVNSPAPDVYDLFHSMRAPEPGAAGELRGGANVAGVSDAALDKALTGLRAVPDTPAAAETRRPLYQSLNVRLKSLVPWVFLWREAGYYAHPVRLEGPDPGPFGLYWNVHEWTWR